MVAVFNNKDEKKIAAAKKFVQFSKDWQKNGGPKKMLCVQGTSQFM